MSTYLLEIGTEELPADFANSVIKQFQTTIEYEFEKYSIKYQSIYCTSTPRRVVIYFEGLVDFGEDKTELRKGPKAESAFKEGNPTNAAIGFAKSLDLDISELEIQDTNKGKFVFGRKITKGSPTKELIASIIPKTLKVIQGQRFMKWGDCRFKFSRPIRWILSLYNNEILQLPMEEIDSNLKIGKLSRGHRLISSDIKIDDSKKYFKTLNDNGVIVKRDDRKTLIANLITSASEKLKLIPDVDIKLLDELTDLVENPNLVIGSFSNEYLTLPSEVLCTVMKKHQRYIPLFTKTKDFNKLDISSKGFLSTNFICISNGLEISKEIIKKGNEKVLKARFADAKFFIESDKSTTSSERNQKIKNISYVKGLGNLSDRVERIFFIARSLNHYLKDHCLDFEIIKESCKYSKNDLCSEIVFELPELQGLMGGKYLKNEGFSEEISLAVSEQYLPRFYKDKLPSSKYGAVLSIADKLETLVSIFVIGKRPSGSSDPFALRRNLNGLIQIIWHFDFDVNLENLINTCINHWKDSVINFKFDDEKVKNELIEFTKQRIISFLEDLLLERNWINAICDSEGIPTERIFKLRDLKKRIDSLNVIKENNKFEEIKNIIARASKLSKTGALETNILSSKEFIKPNLFEKESEKNLYEFIKKIEDYVTLEGWEYKGLINLFEKHLDLVSDIFDNKKGVMIICDNLDLRNNRLNLLSLIRNYSLLIADFTLFNS